VFAGCKDDPEVVSIIPTPIEETPEGEWTLEGLWDVYIQSYHDPTYIKPTQYQFLFTDSCYLMRNVNHWADPGDPGDPESDFHRPHPDSEWVEPFKNHKELFYYEVIEDSILWTYPIRVCSSPECAELSAFQYDSFHIHRGENEGPGDSGVPIKFRSRDTVETKRANRLGDTDYSLDNKLLIRRK
jgi:hypothetical protein